MKQYAQVVSQISLTLNTPKVAVGLIVRYMNLAAKASRHAERGDLAGRSTLLGFVISYMCSRKTRFP